VNQESLHYKDAALAALEDRKVARRRTRLFQDFEVWWAVHSPRGALSLPFLSATTALFLHARLVEKPVTDPKKRLRVVEDCNWFNEQVREVFEPLNVATPPLQDDPAVRQVLEVDRAGGTKVC
jgi:hypothetical protein